MYPYIDYYETLVISVIGYFLTFSLHNVEKEFVPFCFHFQSEYLYFLVPLFNCACQFFTKKIMHSISHELLKQTFVYITTLE